MAIRLSINIIHYKRLRRVEWDCITGSPRRPLAGSCFRRAPLERQHSRRAGAGDQWIWAAAGPAQGRGKQHVQNNLTRNQTAAWEQPPKKKYVIIEIYVKIVNYYKKEQALLINHVTVL